jgi:hypothetical protein
MMMFLSLTLFCTQRENEIQRVLHENERAKEIEIDAINNKWQQLIASKVNTLS